MPTRYLLLTAPFLFCLALLIVNDHVLKAAFPGFLTGKLSDVAGLFAFAYCVTTGAVWLGQRLSGRFVGLRGREMSPADLRSALPRDYGTLPAKTVALLVHVCTGLLFVWWKLPMSEAALAAWNELGIFGLQRTVDPTDLWTLFILPLAYLEFMRRWGVLAKVESDYGTTLIPSSLLNPPASLSLLPASVRLPLGRSSIQSGLQALVAIVAVWSFIASSDDGFNNNLGLIPERPLASTYLLASPLDTLRLQTLRLNATPGLDLRPTSCYSVQETITNVVPLEFGRDSAAFFILYTFRLSAFDSVQSRIDSVVAQRVFPQDPNEVRLTQGQLEDEFSNLPDSVLIRRFEQVLIAPVQVGIRFRTRVEVARCS